MPRKNSSKAEPTVQETVVPIIADTHDYDVAALDAFLDTVFHVELAEDEHVLTWNTRGAPGYPKEDAKLLDTLKRSKAPFALYYGTASTVPDPLGGELRNRKALFKRFFVLVLDDIGTKVPVDKLPEDFDPTYIIESSPGNFQYGYVLAEPITVLEHAEALVQLVYDAGFSDGGGKMATKLVRLPGGVNSKKGRNQNFPVSLHTMDGPLWEPAAILECLNLGVTWDEVLEDTEALVKRRASQTVGTTPWSPMHPKTPSLSGIIDPVLEWLYDENMVKQEVGEWVTIECPWADTHTTGGDWASYSPLGWGPKPYDTTRGFHCFHEHCNMRSGGDFLDFVAGANGPEEAVSERAGHLTSKYAFDALNGGVWEIKDVPAPQHIPMDVFRLRHPETALIHLFDGKQKRVAETTLFINAKNRVEVHGQTYDPSNPMKIVVDEAGRNKINTYTQPAWGDGEYDQDQVNRFVGFINYLIPEKASRRFYLDWLAAKTQDMGFRGPAILMIAEQQGTGRGTLGNMLATLFGRENVENVPFDRLSSSGSYNDWQVSPLIITNETLALGNNDNYYKVYERLKELIDTTPERIRVNPKYGKQRFQTTYSSYLLFSNHTDAMKVADNDRRFYVIKNAEFPWPPEQFAELHDWLNENDEAGKPKWARAVWRWLREREVNVPQMLAPAQMTLAKEEMMSATASAADVAVGAMLDAWPSKLFMTMIGMEILKHYHHRFNLESDTAHRLIKRLCQQHTTHCGSASMRYDGEVRVPRAIRRKLEMNDPILTEKNKRELDIWHAEMPAPGSDEYAAVLKAISDALDQHDF